MSLDAASKGDHLHICTFSHLHIRSAARALPVHLKSVYLVQRHVTKLTDERRGGQLHAVRAAALVAAYTASVLIVEYVTRGELPYAQRVRLTVF